MPELESTFVTCIIDFSLLCLSIVLTSIMYPHGIPLEYKLVLNNVLKKSVVFIFRSFVIQISDSVSSSLYLYSSHLYPAMFLVRPVLVTLGFSKYDSGVSSIVSS